GVSLACGPPFSTYAGRAPRFDHLIGCRGRRRSMDRVTAPGGPAPRLRRSAVQDLQSCDPVEPGSSSNVPRMQKKAPVRGPLAACGWGTRIRTWINGVRVRCPTVRRSPKRDCFGIPALTRATCVAGRTRDGRKRLALRELRGAACLVQADL